LIFKKWIAFEVALGWFILGIFIATLAKTLIIFEVIFSILNSEKGTIEKIYGIFAYIYGK
jgi:hypothetical protein